MALFFFFCWCCFAVVSCFSFCVSLSCAGRMDWDNRISQSFWIVVAASFLPVSLLRGFHHFQTAVAALHAKTKPQPTNHWPTLCLDLGRPVKHQHLPVSLSQSSSSFFLLCHSLYVFFPLANKTLPFTSANKLQYVPASCTTHPPPQKLSASLY